MQASLRKILIAGTALCLSTAPVLAAAPDLGPAQTLDSFRINAATMGDIDSRNIDAYQKQMRAALSITDPPRRDAAVMSARQQLAQNIRKPLTAGTIAELDGLLDLGGVSPQLGATG